MDKKKAMLENLFTLALEALIKNSYPLRSEIVVNTEDARKVLNSFKMDIEDSKIMQDEKESN